MNSRLDELQKLWRRPEAKPLISAARTATPPRRSHSGGSEQERLRRRVSRDSWLKIAFLPVLLLILPLSVDHFSADIAVVFGFSLLA